MNYPTLILFNGPPGSGKDAAGQIVKRYYDGPGSALLTKFANAVKTGSHHAIGANPDPLAFEQIKDVPQPGIMNGRTFREVYIAYSEAFMKPLFGERVFGTMLGNSIRDLYAADDLNGPIPSLILVTDSGFLPEAEELLVARDWSNDLIFDQANVILIRMHRDGCDFEGDSRGYISLNEAGYSVREYDVQNNGTLDDLEMALRQIIGTDMMPEPVYQLQAMLPDHDGSPGWVVIKDGIETEDRALATLQAARQAVYQHRVTRMVRGSVPVLTVWPEDPPVYDFSAEAASQEVSS
jgi:hypothetical protein